MKVQSKLRDALALVGFLGICYAVAALGGLWTSGSVTSWYPGLNKPSWTPPNWLFGPVWSLLYTMMAVAAWLVWRRGEGREAKVGLSLFGTQLLLNLAWSGLFFGLQRPDLGLLDMGALWVAILATAVSFLRVSPVAAGLMLPYLAWVSYAAALNFAIWRLNP
ncbi:MAG: TspO/MBR family protein [Isosphaeraceae bacterium]